MTIISHSNSCDSGGFFRRGVRYLSNRRQGLSSQLHGMGDDSFLSLEVLRQLALSGYLRNSVWIPAIKSGDGRYAPRFGNVLTMKDGKF